MDTKENSKEEKYLYKDGKLIWMRLFFFTKHASGFKPPFTAVCPPQSVHARIQKIFPWIVDKSQKRSNTIINLFICANHVTMVTPCR